MGDPKSMVSSSISFSFCGNFFVTWRQKNKKRKKREGSGAGLELMHATDLFGKKKCSKFAIF